jgi:N-acetylglucosamine kinase-like BadF-type ATPase
VLLAVDAGGTATRAIVLDLGGECLGHGAAGGGNTISGGVTGAADSVARSAQAALTAGAVPGADVASATVAAAGATDETAAAVAAALARIGVRCAPTMELDALAAYFSGTLEATGYGLVAGTGAIAIRVERGAVAAVSDGLGWLVGDAGSGFWIGRRVVRAALAGAERRGPSTALTQMLLDRLGFSGRTDLATLDLRSAFREEVSSVLYSMRPVRLADFAALAFAAADDPVAQEIVAAATTALTAAVTAVARPGVSGPLVFAGGVVTSHPTVAHQIVERLKAEGMAVRAAMTADGTLGAGVLALRAAGLSPKSESHAIKRLVETFPAVRDRVLPAASPAAGPGSGPSPNQSQSHRPTAGPGRKADLTS